MAYFCLLYTSFWGTRCPPVIANMVDIVINVPNALMIMRSTVPNVKNVYTMEPDTVTYVTRACAVMIDTVMHVGSVYIVR